MEDKNMISKLNGLTMPERKGEIAFPFSPTMFKKSKHVEKDTASKPKPPNTKGSKLDYYA